MTHVFVFIGEQKKFLPLHWASETGQVDMVYFHLENTDVDCSDYVSSESCVVGCKAQETLFFNGNLLSILSIETPK